MYKIFNQALIPLLKLIPLPWNLFHFRGIYSTQQNYSLHAAEVARLTHAAVVQRAGTAVAGAGAILGCGTVLRGDRHCGGLICMH